LKEGAGNCAEPTVPACDRFVHITTNLVFFERFLDCRRFELNYREGREDREVKQKG
jgi:hypothetical protein